MRKGRSLRVLTIIALVVAISGLTIAFAAISDAFNHSDEVLWDIQIQDLEADKSGSAVYNLPVISDTSLQNYSVELKKPGDAVHLTFKIVNRGSLDAILSTLIQNHTHCKVENGDSNICKAIKYSLQYEDGSDVAINDLLDPDGEKIVQLSIVYPTSAPAMENGKVIIDSIQLIMLYKQNV